MDHDDFLTAGELHNLAEKIGGGRGSGRVVRVVEDENLGLVQHRPGDGGKIGQETVSRVEGKGVDDSA